MIDPETDEPLQISDSERAAVPLGEKKLERYAVVKALAGLCRRTRVWPSVRYFRYVEQLTHIELKEVWEQSAKEQQAQEVGFENQRRRAEATSR